MCKIMNCLATKGLDNKLSNPKLDSVGLVIIIMKNCLYPDVNFREYIDSRGGHSIVKLNIMCEQSLLPLYYMP